MGPLPQLTPIDPSVTALGDRVRALRRPTGRGLVVALISAYDEGPIQAAIQALYDQETPPDLIVVRGEERLDEALEVVLPELCDEDAILVMDSGSTLDPSFLSEASACLGSGIGGVAGVFTRPGGVRLLPRLEGRTFVLTGTPTLFSVQTLRQVMWAREQGLLPRKRAELHDVNARTEDNERPTLARFAGATAGAAVLGSLQTTGSLPRQA